jgi:hypothetical protein
MLPILRIVPVGGVLLAIMILVLALDPPGGSHPSLPPAVMPARGTLMPTDQHPEWRQFLIHAAFRRADELNRLRELPDTPAHTETVPQEPKVAGLPAGRSVTDADDQTGTISETPSVTMPVDIGEASSTELPVAPPEETPPLVTTPVVKTLDEKPPAITTPVVNPPAANRKKIVHRMRRAKPPAKPQPTTSPNLFEALFGSRQSNQPATIRPPAKHAAER